MSAHVTRFLVSRFSYTCQSADVEPARHHQGFGAQPRRAQTLELKNFAGGIERQGVNALCRSMRHQVCTFMPQQGS
jgi:hypothetical protein